jgi:hypothetical protein
MAHFAQINENNIVVRINTVDNSDCVDGNGIEQENIGIQFLKSIHGNNTNWKQTSYNSSIRKKYAAIGDRYDEERDAFIGQKPYASWTLDETTCKWEAPTPLPEDYEAFDNPYSWNESTQTWDKVR